MSNDLAKRVRMALGPYDDPDRPITAIIGDLRDVIAKAEKERDALARDLDRMRNAVRRICSNVSNLEEYFARGNSEQFSFSRNLGAIVNDLRGVVKSTPSAEDEYLDIPAFERRRNPPKVDSHPAFTNPHTASEEPSLGHHTESPARTGADDEQD